LDWGEVGRKRRKGILTNKGKRRTNLPVGAILEESSGPCSILEKLASEKDRENTRGREGEKGRKF